MQASGYLNPPQARCGHVAAAVSSPTWGEEFLIVHGGINRHKEALDDLVVLQYEQEAWFQPQGSAGATAVVGPAARAFHSGCVLDRKLYIFGGQVVAAMHPACGLNAMLGCYVISSVLTLEIFSLMQACVC